MLMNKKGFTLVELLAVIIVLGLVVVIAFPSVIDTIFKSKDKINNINIKQVEDAGKLVGEEILFCEVNSSTIGVINDSSLTKCTDMQEDLHNGGITLSIDKLKEYKYLSDPNDLCTGKITISADQNSYKISVDVSKAECTTK